MSTLREATYKGHDIIVTYDNDPISPRDNSKQTKILYNHRRYTLWDEKLPEYWESFDHDFKMYMDCTYDITWKEWVEDMDNTDYEKINKFIEDNIIYAPISLYDHSWITLSIWINNWWDSGQVWYIYIHRDDIYDLLNIKAIHTNDITRVEKILEEEIAEYSIWLSWEIYEYRIESLDEYCWWYQSVDEAYEDAITLIDYYIDNIDIERLWHNHEWYTIDDITIRNEIFDWELYEYRIIDRSEEVQALCRYIIETKSESDKFLMLEDLKFLINSEDEYVFSSWDTNDYIDSTSEKYNEHCDNILKLN